MPIESASFISELVTTNPPGTDKVLQGDDHLRLIKQVLRNTFPNAGRPFNFPDTRDVTATGSLTSSDLGKIMVVDPSGGAVTLTLPSLTSADKGRSITILRNTGVGNRVDVQPLSGTINGQPTIHLALEYERKTFWWLGTAWVAEPDEIPIGKIEDFAGSVAPPKRLLCDGRAVSRTTYAQLFAIVGVAFGAGDGSTTFNIPDLRGRVVAGRDNMGGTAAGRLTNSGVGSSGINGNNIGAAGGSDRHLLTQAQMPEHTHTGTTNAEGDHTHTYVQPNAAGSGAAGAAVTGLGTSTQSTGPEGGHNHSITMNNTGGSQAHPNVQPTLVVSKTIYAGL